MRGLGPGGPGPVRKKVGTRTWHTALKYPDHYPSHC